MTEEPEGQDTGAEAVTGSADPAAVALALGGADRGTANAFLNDQRALIDEQRHHLREQFKHLREQYKNIRLRNWEQRLGVLLRLATAVVGIAVAAGFASMIWDASQSNGLLIEPFSVPPDLARNGLTGEVVAAKILDRLVAMQSQTNSVRAPKSYVNSWDEKGIKLDIPETGVSFAELDSFLRSKLGHDTHVTGEIVRTASGLNLTVRAGASGSASATGPEDELDKLLERSTESVYRLTQPYRYGVYLNGRGRFADAFPVYEALRSGSVDDRPWAYQGLGNNVDRRGIDAGLYYFRRAVALAPDNPTFRQNLAGMEGEKSWPEDSISESKRLLSISVSNSKRMVRAEVVPVLREAAQANIDRLSGAFHEAVPKLRDVTESGIPGRFNQQSGFLAQAELGEHDLGAARATLADPIKGYATALGTAPFYVIRARMLMAGEAGDWPGVLSQEHAMDSLFAEYPGLRSLLPTMVAPLSAYAQARLGNIANAEARIAPTPADCYDCLVARARIADLRGQHSRADWWFDRAVAAAPSIPFAEAYWGTVLLERAQPDAAIEKFKLANQKGAHYADPLEGWGEALMAKNQSHLALAKFVDAEKYAPNWGRLHLKWGEALVYAGKKDEAKKQFQKASTLDLTPADKTELARVSHV